MVYGINISAPARTDLLPLVMVVIDLDLVHESAPKSLGSRGPIASEQKPISLGSGRMTLNPEITTE